MNIQTFCPSLGLGSGMTFFVQPWWWCCLASAGAAVHASLSCCAARTPQQAHFGALLQDCRNLHVSKPNASVVELHRSRLLNNGQVP